MFIKDWILRNAYYRKTHRIVMEHWAVPLIVLGPYFNALNRYAFGDPRNEWLLQSLFLLLLYVSFRVSSLSFQSLAGEGDGASIAGSLMTGREILAGKMTSILFPVFAEIALFSPLLILLGLSRHEDVSRIIAFLLTTLLIGALFATMGVFISQGCRNRITAAAWTFGGIAALFALPAVFSVITAILYDGRFPGEIFWMMSPLFPLLIFTEKYRPLLPFLTFYGVALALLMGFLSEATIRRIEKVPVK